MTIICHRKISAYQPSHPLVIEGLKNRNWKSEARARRRGKNLLPPEVIAAAKENAVQAKVEGDRSVMQDNVNTEWGLNIRQRQRTEKAVMPTPEAQSNLAPISEEAQTSEKVKEKSLSLDDEALQALLKKDKEESGRELVIPVEDSLQPVEPMTEYDAYKRAVAVAPEPSKMEDYERVPVEEFGAALLRGMGWNGKKIGGTKEVKRLQNLLGLGAKELKESEFIGAWVNKSDAKKLNTNLTGGKDRRPRAGEYMREEEKRREERVGGSYRREREIDTRRRGRFTEREELKAVLSNLATRIVGRP
ncbi:hypothetical protein K3495_g11866 [Podosphaera aphanis]|nr:hypothetical protein K3495_g11866 [Podosphaera aphanis]